MTRTSDQAAMLLAALFKRASLTRARVSEKTIRKISGRSMLRHAFRDRLQDALEDFGLHLVELERGGYAMIAISTLEGAKTILAKRYLSNELRQLKRAKSREDVDGVCDVLRHEVEQDGEADDAENEE